jgi:hypothetical protein
VQKCIKLVVGNYHRDVDVNLAEEIKYFCTYIRQNYYLNQGHFYHQIQFMKVKV